MTTQKRNKTQVLSTNCQKLLNKDRWVKLDVLLVQIETEATWLSKSYSDTSLKYDQISTEGKYVIHVWLNRITGPMEVFLLLK